MEISPLRRLCHWGPLIVLGIIKLITWAMIHLLGMWWPPLESFGGALHAALFLNLAACTVYFFLHSLIEGPGIVPVGWKPDDKQARKYLQFCTVCKGYKPPRAHHCRTCGNCIMKMDHHCPWINNCVGHANHGFFIMFLTSAVSGCFQATIVLTICMYHAINRVWYQRHGTGQEPIIHLTLTTLPLTLLAIGMALGVVLAVGVLLYFQVVGILKNQTTIEEWIVEKAYVRRARVRLPPFVFPYDMGPDTNLRLALTGEGNGLWWPIRSGCGPYDLTIEQIEQKKDKRRRAVVCVCLRGYSGWWLPLLEHPRAATAPPCSAEPRLPLAPGQRLTVTRYRRHWLYGELLEEISPVGEGRGPRGWFPRACVYTPRHKPD